MRCGVLLMKGGGVKRVRGPKYFTLKSKKCQRKKVPEVGLEKWDREKRRGRGEWDTSTRSWVEGGGIECIAYITMYIYSPCMLTYIHKQRKSSIYTSSWQEQFVREQYIFQYISIFSNFIQVHDRNSLLESSIYFNIFQALVILYKLMTGTVC